MQEDIPVKVVEIQSYMKMLREMIDEGNEVPLLITGGSMLPFLAHCRDTILIRKAKLPLKKGDMAFFQRDNGAYIMHRIQRVQGDNYYFVGDAQTEIEGPIRGDQIFGEITRVRRKGKWIGPRNFWWIFFRYVWLRIIPLRRPILRMYGAVRKVL